MNVRLLLGLCFLSHLSLQALQAQQVKTFSDLKKGDWFTLEYVKYYPSPEEEYSFRNADIFEYRVTVSDRTNRDLLFAISPARVCFHKTVYTKNEKARDVIALSARTAISVNNTYSNSIRLSLINPMTQEGAFKAGYFHYFDSYYCQDFVLESPIYVGNQDVVTFKLSLQTGLLSDTTYFLDKKGWQYTTEMIFDGLKKKSPLFSAYSTTQTDAKPFFDEIIRNFFSNCNPLASLPWLLEGQLENETIYRIQITDASFHLAPNVKLCYYSSEKLPPKDLLLEINDRKYDLQQDANGFVNFEFFMPTPALGNLINKPIAITPGDSISIKTDDGGNVTFSGKGSENCQYWYELSKHQTFLDKSVLSPSLEPYLASGDSIFQTLWHQFASQMSPYWRESSQLSYHYWYMYKTIQSQIKQNSIIDFERKPFQSVTPFIDHFFKPQYYTSFMNLYSDYTLREIYRDVLTRTAYHRDDLLPKYYLQKGLFAGYPKYLMLSETLLKLMETTVPSNFQKEFDDFISECKDPVLVQKVKQEYDLSVKVQPGKNIRDLQLTIENELPLKKTADGYILIIMGRLRNAGTGPEYQEGCTNMLDSLNAMGLKTKIQVISPERYQYLTRLDTTNSRAVVHFNESEDLLKDCRTIRSKNNSMLLIRNDGVIVAKDMIDTWTRTLVDGKDKKVFQTETIRALIEEDMERNKKAGLNYSNIIVIIGISCLLSGGISYFLLKARVKRIQKKEANKRLIAELELKAIRSQMNPHFIFNALGSIQRLINQGKNNEANQYLLHFSKLLRMVLATSEKKLVSLSDEIEQLELYLQLEQLRMPFEYRIEIDRSIQPENEEIPGMLIQPIVENAVKHGVNGKQGRTITLRFSKEAHVLLAEISDDGEGFPSSSLTMNGFGLKATDERLRLINEDFKANICIRMEQNHPTGTSVVISIPV
jgi:two-component sensor histidine kinase